MNPKDAKQANPRLVFDTASAFDRAYHILSATLTDKPYVRAPSPPLYTCAALSLELYLKCLLIIEHGSYIEDHDLSKLFNLLRSQTKRALKKRYAKWVKEETVFPELLNFTTFEALLEACKLTFTKGRYSFELNPFSWTLDGLTVATKERILRLHPDWAD